MIETYSVKFDGTATFDSAQGQLVSASGSLIIAPSTPITAPAVRVSSGRFVDADGESIQLRGCSVSGLEFVAIQGWSPENPWGGQTGTQVPPWTVMKNRWGFNTVRLPLNQASWLGYPCFDGDGAERNPDPGGNYRQTVINAVAECTALGLNVILDLHWSNPLDKTPKTQNVFADFPRSIDFWSSVANTFKAYPNVLFELFNEPIPWRVPPGINSWAVYRDGGTMTGYIEGGYSPNGSFWREVEWQAAGFQQMLAAIRATGATNVCLIAGNNWAGDLSEWSAFKVSDPLGQIGATWHVYPAYGAAFGTPEYQVINNGGSWAQADAVISAGSPVLITELGDQNSPGTPNAPFASAQLAEVAARATGTVGVLGWTWNVWPYATEHVLIINAEGDPTDGWGREFYTWNTNRV